MDAFRDAGVDHARGECCDERIGEPVTGSTVSGVWLPESYRDSGKKPSRAILWN